MTSEEEHAAPPPQNLSPPKIYTPLALLGVLPKSIPRGIHFFWGGGYCRAELLELSCAAPPPPPPPLCDIPSRCCSFTGPWTVTRSCLRVLRRVAAFSQPLRPVLPLVSFPHSRSPVVGVPGLCWMSPPPPPPPEARRVLSAAFARLTRHTRRKTCSSCASAQACPWGLPLTPESEWKACHWNAQFGSVVAPRGPPNTSSGPWYSRPLKHRGRSTG